MAFHYTTKSDLQTRGTRYMKEYWNQGTDKPRYCANTKNYTKVELSSVKKTSKRDFGDVCEAQKNFFDRYATVLSTDIRENILKYKQNVRNAADEYLASYGIMDTSRDYPDIEPFTRRPSLRISNSSAGNTLSRHSALRRSLQDVGKLRGSNTRICSDDLDKTKIYSNLENKTKD